MILVIPDIHEEVGRLHQIRPLLDQADRRIFLGDWLDSYDLDSDTLGTLQYLKEAVQDPKNDFCIGNHDCQYFFTHQFFHCSGWRHRTTQLVRENLNEDEKRRFKLFHRVGDTILSHAGYHPVYLNPLGEPKDGGSYSLPSAKEAEQAMDQAFGGGFHKLFNAGLPVGGRGIGGPTWCRWDQEFVPLNFSQIVGHTPHRSVQVETSEAGIKSYDLDTQFHNLMWLNDDGTPHSVVDLNDGV